MQVRLDDLVTVSPPTFDRNGFAWADRNLGDAHAPYARSWLMSRFDEGLQIRMLPPPAQGFVLFQPGRLCWRPIDGLDDAMVVHDLRVRPGPGAKAGARALWDGVAEFARFYGVASVLAVLGREEGLIPPELAPGRGWVQVDDGPDGARLTMRVLHGPVTLPRFPRDWRARAASVGPGPVIQTNGASDAIEARATRLCARAIAGGIFVRREVLTSPMVARGRAVSPGATFSALLDGVRIGGADLSDDQILSVFGCEARDARRAP